LELKEENEENNNPYYMGYTHEVNGNVYLVDRTCVTLKEEAVKRSSERHQRLRKAKKKNVRSDFSGNKKGKNLDAIWSKIESI
jgi:hypothetical protein